MQGQYLEAEQRIRYSVDALLVASNNEVMPSSMPILLQLAGITRILGKYAESDRLHRTVLTAQETNYGRQSTEVATTLCSWGVLLMEQYKLKEASEYLDESLHTRSQIYGEKHPDVASSLNNIGSLLDMLGKHEEAKEKFEAALQIRLNIYGSSHPSVAQSLNNIGNLMCNVGNYDEAEQLFNLSHRIIKKLFGGGHPEVVVSTNNLAGLLDVKGDFNRSMTLHQECFETRKATLGQGHLLCAQSMNNIGSSLLLQNKLNDAAAMYQEALNIRRRVHGNDRNVDIAEGFSNQASVYMAEGRYQIAAKLQRQASQVMEDILGSHHPSTVNVKGNLGISCRRNGEIATGNDLLREAAEYLAYNQYPARHPWVVKFSNEARVHGDYGGPLLGACKSSDGQQEDESTQSIHPSVTSARLKDIQKHKPVRLNVDRSDSMSCLVLLVIRVL